MSREEDTPHEIRIPTDDHGPADGPPQDGRQKNVLDDEVSG